MGRPQGRRLGYHTPEQASNRGPRDSRLCITAASRYHLPQRRGCVTRKNPDSILHMAAVNPDPCWSTRARALEHTCIGAHAHMRWSTRALEHTCIGAHVHRSTLALEHTCIAYFVICHMPSSVHEMYRIPARDRGSGCLAVCVHERCRIPARGVSDRRPDSVSDRDSQKLA